MKSFEIDGRNVWSICELIIKTELDIDKVDPEASLMMVYHADSLGIFNIITQCTAEFNVRIPDDEIRMYTCTLGTMVQEIKNRYEVK